MGKFIIGWALALYLLGYTGYVVCQVIPCNDVNTAACTRMLSSKPDLCKDQALSAACRRFCGICPLVCYDCPTAMSGPDECNTTKSCNQGEVCMRKEHSPGDGSTEYILSCETKTVCEGLTLGFHLVGKRQLLTETRDIQRRDMTFRCCEVDLCNWPANFTTTPPPTTTTTSPTTSTTTLPTTSLLPLHTCARDIVFVADGSSTVGTNQRYISPFIDQVASRLSIGMMDSLVSLVIYSDTAIVEWYLPDHPSRTDLNHALHQVTYIHGSTATHAALWLVRNSVLTASHGDRPNAKNVIILITDGGTDNSDLAISEAKTMHADGVDVIAVSVGRSASEAELRQMIKPAGNFFHVTSYNYLSTIRASLAALICK